MREQAARRYDAGVGLFSGTGIGIARDKDPDDKAIDADTFLHENLGFFEATVRELFVDHHVIENGPFAMYLNGTGFPGRFGDLLYNEHSVISKLPGLVAPESITKIINRARQLDWEQKDESSPAVRTDKGQPSYWYAKPVVIEIGNALVRRYYESIERMFARVARAHRGMVNNQVRDVLVSHPMDLLVKEGLTAVPTERFAYAIANKAVTLDGSDEPTNDIAEIAFPPRLWHWVEATPVSATKEQVATALFGKPEEAYRLTALAPLWGFHSEDVAAMTPTAMGKLKTAVSKAVFSMSPEPEAHPPRDILAAVGLPYGNTPAKSVDPAAELVASRGDDIAMARVGDNVFAPQLPAEGTVDVPMLIEALAEMIDNLGDIAKLAAMFGGGDAATSAQSLQIARRDELRTMSPANLDVRYALANAQRMLVRRITLGLGDAGGRLVQLGGAAAPPGAHDVLAEEADAFIGGLVALELPELAGPRVDDGERLQQNIDISIQEAMLHERLGELDSELAIHAKDGGAHVDAAKQSDQFDKLEWDLADARVTMRKDPARAITAVAAMKPKTEKLVWDIGLSEKLRRLDAIWDAISGMEGFWELGGDYKDGLELKQKNRVLYERFRDEVMKPYEEGEKEQDDTKKQQARDAYSALLAKDGPLQTHAKEAVAFLKKVAKHERWTKFIVSLAIAFVAFGLGQWEFTAILAADATATVEAAVAAGVVTTATSVTLNKLILNQNPTLVGVATSFAFNAGTFFVVGKMAMAARAAGVEAAMAEGTEAAIQGADKIAPAATATSTAAKVGNYAWGLAKEAIVAEVMGVAQGEVEKLLSEGKTLSWSELGDMFGQQLIAVVAMRVAHAGTELVSKGADHKLAVEIEALSKEREKIQIDARRISENASKSPHGKPDVAATMDLLKRWGDNLERERVAREALIKLAEKHPDRFKPGDVERLKAGRPDPTLVRQIREAKAMLAIEPSGINKFSCAPGALDTVVSQHESMGNKIVDAEVDPDTGQRTVEISPADGSANFKITEKLAPKNMRTAAAERFSPELAKHFQSWKRSQRWRIWDRTQMHALEEINRLYATDPMAAIKLAQTYGYEPPPMLETGLPKTGDAKARFDVNVPAADRATAVTLGRGVAAIGEGRYLAAPRELFDVHAEWDHKGGKPSKITYDPKTRTSHFEVEVGGKRVRVEAHIQAAVGTYRDVISVKNRIVGEPMSLDTGESVMRAIAKQDYSTIGQATGISGEVMLPDAKIEFGLAKISETEYLLVVGEPSGVDWADLPGLEPAAHTHPLHKDNDLVREDGAREAPVANLVNPRFTNYTNRKYIFPTVEDIVLMAEMKVVGHRVLTGYVFEGGNIRKPKAGDSAPNVEFTIGEGKQIGVINGKRVYESTLTAKAGSATPISERAIWVVEEKPGGSGEIWLERPPNIEPLPQRPTGPGPSGSPKTTRATDPVRDHLIATHGKADVEWADTTVAHDKIGPTLEALTKLPPDPRAMVRALSGADAHELLTTLGPDRVATALKLGPTGPMTPERLLELRRRFGNDRAVIDMLESAGSKEKFLQRIARVADGLEQAGKAPQSVVGTDSVVLDSNARSAIEDLLRGRNKKNAPVPDFAALDDNYKDAINAIRKARGHGPYVDPPAGTPLTLEWILGGKTDLRTPQVARAEGLAGEKISGTPSQVLPHTTGLEVNRASPEYENVIVQLKAAKVGTETGALDRTIVADTLLAQRSGTPTLVSVDQNVITNLAANFGTPDKVAFKKGDDHMDVLNAKFPDGKFTVSINGRLLDVRFK